MGESANGGESLGSFRQKTGARRRESGVPEALEGFWGGCRGFVLILRVVAGRGRVVRVLRELQEAGRVGGSVKAGNGCR
jgi:hypothetical protein